MHRHAELQFRCGKYVCTDSIYDISIWRMASIAMSDGVAYSFLYDTGSTRKNCELDSDRQPRWSVMDSDTRCNDSSNQ